MHVLKMNIFHDRYIVKVETMIKMSNFVILVIGQVFDLLVYITILLNNAT